MKLKQLLWNRSERVDQSKGCNSAWYHSALPESGWYVMEQSLEEEDKATGIFIADTSNAVSADCMKHMTSHFIPSSQCVVLAHVCVCQGLCWPSATADPFSDPTNNRCKTTVRMALTPLKGECQREFQVAKLCMPKSNDVSSGSGKDKRRSNLNIRRCLAQATALEPAVLQEIKQVSS